MRDEFAHLNALVPMGFEDTGDEGTAAAADYDSDNSGTASRVTRKSEKEKEKEKRAKEKKEKERGRPRNRSRNDRKDRSRYIKNIRYGLPYSLPRIYYLTIIITMDH